MTSKCRKRIRACKSFCRYIRMLYTTASIWETKCVMCLSLVLQCCGASCSFMVWRRRQTAGWSEMPPVTCAGCEGPDGPRATRLSSPAVACSSSTAKESRWPQLSQKSPSSSSSPSCRRRRCSSFISLSSSSDTAAPLKPLLPRVPHRHISIPESPVKRRLLPLGRRSLSSVQPSDKSFSRGSLQELSALSARFSWLESSSLWSCPDISITPESGADCPGLLSGFDLMDKLGVGGSSMLGLQHRLLDTGGVGVGWTVCPSCCSGASGLEAAEVGAVCKALYGGGGVGGRLTTSS